MTTSPSIEPAEAVCDDPATPSETFLRLIPFDFAREHLILSTGGEGPTERVLVSESTPPDVIHNTGVALSRRITVRVTSEEAQLAEAIERAYAERDEGPASNEAGSGEVLPVDDLSDLLSTAGKGDVVKLVDAMLFEAVRCGASDLHLQPTRAGCETRLRVDGVLLRGRSISAGLSQTVISRVKVMGGMDTAESRVPQDGRTTVTIGADKGDRTRRIDLRISTLPSRHGERVVIRLLDTDRGDRLTSFDSLGMPVDTRQRFTSCVQRPNGIVLLTGPTGSGKTTTLYATLRWVAMQHTTDDACALNILTIEDPVEFELYYSC